MIQTVAPLGQDLLSDRLGSLTRSVKGAYITETGKWQTPESTGQNQTRAFAKSIQLPPRRGGAYQPSVQPLVSKKTRETRSGVLPRYSRNAATGRIGQTPSIQEYAAFLQNAGECR